MKAQGEKPTAARDESDHYRKLRKRFWTSEWAVLGPPPASPHMLLLYLAVGPVQRAPPGVLPIGEGELSDRLGWSIEEVRQCMGALVEAGLVQFDKVARLIWLPWRYDHEPPENPNQVTGWRAVFNDQWPRGPLADSVRLCLRRRLTEGSPSLVQAFDAVTATLPKTVAGTVSRTVPKTVAETVGGNQRRSEAVSSEAVKQKSNCEKQKPSAVGAAGELSPPSHGNGSGRKKPPTDDEVRCRKAIRDAFSAEYAKRAEGAEFQWDDASENTAVARWATKCGNDRVGALKMLSEYIARMDDNAFYARNFKPSQIARVISDLRIPVKLNGKAPKAGHARNGIGSSSSRDRHEAAAAAAAARERRS